ncbi:ALMS1 centrosome and basal body associated protein isoform X2 [Genypterus blacodes]|uniref:ALMS1 centrosome and basal body associated protein isoform X2 n=1 Tax=Genypterus blacodes TaxID=154954 RepID=UPI003F760EB3
MELPERAELPVQLPADQDVAQSVGPTAIDQDQAQSDHDDSQDQRQSRLTIDDWELQQHEERALQLEFQDSNLSPALSLMPRVEQNFTEYSFFQQSDVEFVPLRAYPDLTVASERFDCPPKDSSLGFEHGQLSQHPLAQETTLSDDRASSCYLSQHSLSPGSEDGQEMVHSPLDSRLETQPSEGTSSKEKDAQALSVPSAESVEDDTFFLRKDVPAQHLLRLLQKDVGMPSGSSSAVSSASERTGSFSGDSKRADRSTFRREVVPGEASVSGQQKRRPERQSFPDQTLVCEVSNISMGSRSTQPDDSSEELRRELLSEVESHRSWEAGTKRQPTPPEQPVAPSSTDTSEGKPSVTRTGSAGTSESGLRLSGGYTVERGYRERDILSLVSQTGIDGSYLGFLPQSQSTPGVFRAPTKSSVKARLSDIESNTDNSSEPRASISPQHAVPVADMRSASQDSVHSGPSKSWQEETTTAKVQTLPSLNYMQKVDAWRANHALRKPSLFDSLALQGFSGVSPKKKAYDAVSDTLNRMLSQQVRSVHQSPVSIDTNKSVTQSSSAAHSGSSSPRRGEAVGSAPSSRDDTGYAVQLPASPLGRSQSHSSLSTVLSAQKSQQTESSTKPESSQTQQDVPQQSSVTKEPLPFVSLGQFSDVSVDGDETFSNSQGSCNSGKNVGASVGASSVVSLDVDNYVPFWNSKALTPPTRPRSRELNIEERIPMYLHNLGIDQSPSAILTPFAPRGPIREPEFSPTDLCTIKGSIGTPTKSSQPSEGGSPHKGEFSRSSVLSVASSTSLPLSLNSLCQAVSVPEPTTASSSLVTAGQSGQKQASYHSEETSNVSTQQVNQQQQGESDSTSSQNTNQQRDRVESDNSLFKDKSREDKDFESHLQAPCGPEQNSASSSVESKALSEMQVSVYQAQTTVNAQSSVGSSPDPTRLLSDDDIFLSVRRKTGKFQDSFFSSASATDPPGTQPSFLWARSSSDSMLTSEKPSTSAPKSVSSLGQPDRAAPPAPVAAPILGQYFRPPDNPVSRSMGLSLVLSQTSRRAEPEGCSAAPPDSLGPAQPPVIRSSLRRRAPQHTSSPAKTAALPAKHVGIQGGPVGGSSSSAVTRDLEQGALSDEGSESSLAARVVQLLHSKSAATMTTSTATITDQEESRAREWSKLKMSEQWGKSMELDIEDRMRIEEIKRDLLLEKPIMSQGSTDTESSVPSSVGGLQENSPPQPAEEITSLSGVEDQLFHLNASQSNSNVQLQALLPPDLAAMVQEIAAREGVSPPRSSPQALTSITIATRRRSISPTPSASPAPSLSPAAESLHLCQLSTEASEHHAVHRELPQVVDEEEGSASTQSASPKAESVSRPNSLHTGDQIMSSSSVSETENQERKDTEGSQSPEESPPSSGGLDGKYFDAMDMDNRHGLSGDAELSNKDSSVSSVDLEAERTPGLSAVGSPAVTGHISQVHLTLSPKIPDRSSPTDVQSSNAAAVVSRQPSTEFVPLRHSSVPSSPDEGVGSAGPPHLHDTREPIRAQGPERVDTSMQFKPIVPLEREISTSPQFKPIVPLEREISTSPQSFTSSHQPSPRSLQTAESPVLLPYKPHGSEELFYVPQTEADVSTEHSNTTMESSHTGSDDAVPPRFSNEILGHDDPGLDRGVTIRHAEGIYSKRSNTASFTIQELGPSGESVVRRSHTLVSGSPQPSVPLMDQDLSSSRGDLSASPVRFLSCAPISPVNMEMNYDHASHHPSTHVDQSFVLKAGEERHQRSSDTAIAQPSPQHSSSILDRLWDRFCEGQHQEESRPTSEKETSLLERLERLSRLIHSPRAPSVTEQQYETHPGPDTTAREERKEDIKEIEIREIGSGAERKGRGSREVDSKHSTPPQAWTQMPHAEADRLPTEEDNRTSSNSTNTQSSSYSLHLCPAQRDECDTSSTTSGSMSTVDTARLIRAFGAHRVLHPKTSSSLSKLYSAIDRQKGGSEERRGGRKHKEQPRIPTPLETTGTDKSMARADSTSTSTSSLPSHHGPSRSLKVKKAVKLVTRGIRAGDLEIVVNGNPRHTRDFGTTFPSPSEDRASRHISSSSSDLERGRGGQKSQKKSKRTPAKSYPDGVSWFISAGNLKGQGRKENRPEEGELIRRPSTSWFEPHRRTDPWREPLRQRQVQEERNASRRDEPKSDLRSKTVSSGVVRISLQEALEMHRPDFISRSRQRVTRLALQTEERRLQTVFSRERGEVFYYPRPAGTALLRRAVPRKEMIQRSKQIYESLPEVQRRKEEERRKAEYRSYRLNAQLYNKIITSRVLGRRIAWQ